MVDVKQAKISKTSNWSLIWVLPIIALLIGAWLGWRAYQQSGIEIQVYFPSGEGIQANKTELFYKGMAVGRVTGMVLDDEQSFARVKVSIEVDKSLASNLRTGTRFWLVSPSVSLAGISGLDTLLSGNYIALSPGAGEPAREFEALDQAPPLSESWPGLHLTLKADQLGSLNRESPVFYKQIQVGRVSNYKLAEDQRSVEVRVFIQPEFASLVKQNTRFWNASGITFDASISGIKVRTESLASVLVGGIAFATPEHVAEKPLTDPAQPFRLYENFDAAQSGIRVSLTLNDFDGVTADRTPVIYKGVQIGVVQRVVLEDSLSAAKASLVIDPMVESFLTESAEFWLVKPSISLAGVTGLEALVKGNYIAISPGEKSDPPARQFVARNQAPPLDFEGDGQYMVLLADNLGSLQVGSPILYRQIKVGSIQSTQFTRDRKQVAIGAYIEPEYAHLVNSSTRFWNASGISVKASLSSGVELQSESLQAILVGGVSFETTDFNAPARHKVQRFNLYPSREEAFEVGTAINVFVASAEGISVGSPLRYRGLEVGKVEQMDLRPDLGGVKLGVRVFIADQQIAREGSEFWVVKPTIGLMGAEHLQTLISGQYLEVLPARKSAKPKSTFIALDAPPSLSAIEAGLRLVLSAGSRGSLKVGVKVNYRGMPVGRVTGLELGPTADRVLVHVLIEPRYAPLVRARSQFWNVSGIDIEAGVFSGLTVRTESLIDVLEGGIAFSTPDNEHMGGPALPGQTFALHEQPNADWLKWVPKIRLAAEN